MNHKIFTLVSGSKCSIILRNIVRVNKHINFCNIVLDSRELICVTDAFNDCIPPNFLRFDAVALRPTTIKHVTSRCDKTAIMLFVPETVTVDEDIELVVKRLNYLLNNE